MNSSFAQLLVRWLVLAVGVALAANFVPGISCDNGAALFTVVVLLSLFNAILKPVLVLFTLPFILLIAVTQILPVWKIDAHDH